MTAIARSQPRAVGLAGSLFGLLALIAALLPTWVLPAVLPIKPLDQIVVLGLSAQECTPHSQHSRG